MTKYYKGHITLPIERYLPKVTEKAICLTVACGYTGANDRYEWFPKSQIIISEPNEVGNAEILIPVWLFRSKQISADSIRECDFNPYEIIER